MNYEALKARQRAERETYHPNLALRVHRSLSWLSRAERSADDLDGRFIFLWIAFNAAYATDIDEKYRGTEQAMFREFLQKLVSLDKKGSIEALAWNEFPNSIRLLLDNKFIFQDFWLFHAGRMTEEQWKEHFASANKAAHLALGRRDTVAVLGIVLSRMYTLRNQIMHGGATWHGRVNREQVRDGGDLLGKLVPVIIELMMGNVGTLWGDAYYPVVT